MKNIKYLIVILMAFATSIASKSQTHYSANVAVGVKGGMDLSRMFFNPSVEQGFKPGAMGGVMFRYIEESHFGLVAELNFIQRGWQETFEGEPFMYKRTLDYVELPVLAHIYFGRRGRFFANVGPLVALRISDSYKSNFNIDDTSSLEGFPKYHETGQYTEPVKQRVDYGICAGLGGEFNVTPKHSLILEARFYYGLGNLFGASRKDNFNASNAMTLEFTVGYWLRLK